MICSSCGFDGIEDGSETCRVCGANLNESTAIFDGEPTMPGDVSSSPAPVAARNLSYRQGEVYANRYRIEAFLGRGGMGTVYRVRDLEKDRDLALKVLSPAAAEEVGGVDRFKREIQILSKIKHPAVPRVHGWGVREGEMFFVADFIEGENLRVILRRDGRFAPTVAASLAARIADALTVAHEHGVIHRDVKPHNIMMSGDGSVFLLDFGVARGVGLDMKTITATGMVVGTPEYMSPEQFEGLRVDARSDIYSLGVVLFEAVTGRPPFTGDTPIAVALKHRSETPPTPRSMQGDVPSWLDRIIVKCLDKDPARRFATAGDLAAVLRKERKGERRVRKLPTGDSVIEDESESEEWALVITGAEKKEWSQGMALRFEDRFYRLDDLSADLKSKQWTYRFSFWPQEEIFRKMVDYDVNAVPPPSLGEKLKGWFGR